MREKGFLVNNYSKCFNFLREARWHIVFAFGLFCFIFLIGFAFPIFFRAEIFSFLEELTSSIEGKNAVELIGFIFFNNLKASFFAMVLGIGFGVFPLITTVVNGYLLGFVGREAVSFGGLLIMWRLLPHGIFELPAVIFSIGIGMKIGFDLIGPNDGKKVKRLDHNLREGFRVFLFVVLPLLVIAGVIEGSLIFLGA